MPSTQRSSTGRSPARPALPALAGLCQIAMLTGCTMEPEYHTPAAPIAMQYPTSQAAAAAQGIRGPAATPMDPPLQTADIGWKVFFQDRQLQDLIARALVDNRQLRVTEASMEQARALYGASRSKLFPEFAGSATAQRERLPGLVQTSANGTLVPVVNASNSAVTFNAFQVQAGVTSFELDLFGSNRAAMHSAQARADASAANYQAARLALVGEVANAYLALQADLALQALSVDTSARRDKYAGTMSQAYRQGGVAEFDTRRADTLARSAKVDLDTANLRVERDMNALTLLVGGPVPPEDLKPTANATAMLASVPEGLPSSLLTRRPDIAAAEAQLREANADIGHARSAFFPTITLTGLLGTLSGNLSGVFGAGSATWLGGAAVNVPFFDWGYRQRQLDATRAEWRGALASYDNVVQHAFRDVADALAIRDHMTVRLQEQTALVDELRRVEQISRLRFQSANGNFTDVQDAERTRFTEERQLIEMRLSANVNMVNLYQSLGGGWTADSVANSNATQPAAAAPVTAAPSPVSTASTMPPETTLAVK